jgi:hypothetical protein
VAVWIESDVLPVAGEAGSWVVLTAGMLQSRIAAPQYNMITSSAMQGLQADPVPQILADVTESVRDAVRSGSKVAIGPDGTIPSSLKTQALTLAKYELYSRVPSMATAIELLRPDKVAADAYLVKVAQGTIRPASPTTGTETETSNTNVAASGSETKIGL